MGCREGASSLNSGRRNAVNGVQKGAVRAGFDVMNAKKVINHRGGGHKTRECVYEDTTASTDIGALLSGRTPQVIESLLSVASTRVPKLALTQTFEDIAADDELRKQLFDDDERRLALVETVKRFEAAAKRLKQKAKVAAALLELKDVKSELNSYTRRLKARVLRKKRQQIYDEGQRELLSMPLEEYKVRM
eukprot:526614-Prymnesium_polylepis.1